MLISGLGRQEQLANDAATGVVDEVVANHFAHFDRQGAGDRGLLCRLCCARVRPTATRANVHAVCIVLKLCLSLSLSVCLALSVSVSLSLSVSLCLSVSLSLSLYLSISISISFSFSISTSSMRLFPSVWTPETSTFAVPGVFACWRHDGDNAGRGRQSTRVELARRAVWLVTERVRCLWSCRSAGADALQQTKVCSTWWPLCALGV
jgi:hypothetical protein